MFIENIFTNFQFYISWILIILFSVCFHEFCHAYVAYLNGDDTAKNKGFFTINPLLQMGPQSLILLFFIGICWGACPTRQDNFRHEFSASFVAAAGPLGNLLLSIIFAIITAIMYFFLNDNTFFNNLYKFMFMGSVANFALCIFNLIPVPPLDGHTIVKDVYPRAMLTYNKMGPIGFIAVLFLFSIPGVSEGLYKISSIFSTHLANLAIKSIKMIIG